MSEWHNAVEGHSRSLLYIYIYIYIYLYTSNVGVISDSRAAYAVVRFCRHFASTTGAVSIYTTSRILQLLELIANLANLTSIQNATLHYITLELFRVA